MSLVESTQEGRLAVLTINRPESMNALNEEVLMELRSALISLEDVQVVILTGAGDKAFVAGADIKAMQEMEPVEARAFAEIGQGVMQMFEEAPFVSIAAVNGFALGGGLELALACDLIYSSDNALFGAPETNLGIIPGFGGTVNLYQRIGFHSAMEWILTGKTVKADEAKRLQLVLDVFSKQELMPKVKEIGNALSNKGIFSLLAARRLIRGVASRDSSRSMLLERESFANLFATGEPQEGMAAFLEKRSPQFHPEDD